MRNTGIALAAVMMVWVTASASQAQIVYGQHAFVAPRVVYQTWSVETRAGDKTTTTQWAMPVHLYVPIVDNVEVRVRTSWMRSDVGQGALYRLSGASDTQVQGAWALLHDTVLLNVGVSVPTGKKALTEAEQRVSESMGSEVFGFPVKRAGEGLDVSMGAGCAKKAGPIVWGVGASYLRKGTYTPSEGGSSYKPGDRATLTGGVDWTAGRVLVRTDGIYTRYSADEREGEAVYRNGAQTEVQASLTVRGKVAFHVMVWDIMRSKSRYRGGSGGLEEEAANSYGNDLRVRGELWHPLRDAVWVKGSMHIKQIGANGYESGEARYRGRVSLVGWGGGLQVRSGSALRLEVGGRYWRGTAWDGAEDVTGMEVSGSLWYGL